MFSSSVGAASVVAKEKPQRAPDKTADSTDCTASKIDADRILALAYFDTGDINNARTALTVALSCSPDDLSLNEALLEVLLADKDYQNAKDQAVLLGKLGAADVASFGEARVQLATGKRNQALDQLQALADNSGPPVSSLAADLLIEELYVDRKYGTAYQVAQAALVRDPASAFAFRFERVPPDSDYEKPFAVELGYRLEYDDNATFPDEDVATGQEDFRHVFIADVLYRKPFANGFNFYAEGHALQTFYQDLGDLNQTRISGAVGIGQQGERFGWRVPVELNADWLDGDAFKTSVAVIPGINIRLSDRFFSHFYFRLQNDDYKDVLLDDEDRSGDVTGGGILLGGEISTQWQIHGYLEYRQYDTDGDYWDRDQFVGFVYAEYEFRPDWVAGMAVRYQDEDFDNIRPVFAEHQRDKSKELYLNLTHRFSQHWRARAQISLIDRTSTIPLFEYDRNVYSIGVTWDF